MFFIVSWLTITTRAATVNFSQARPNILIFLTSYFLQDCTETRNLGKAKALGALPAMATLTTDVYPMNVHSTGCL